MEIIAISYFIFGLGLLFAAFYAARVNSERMARRQHLAAQLRPGIKSKEAEKIVEELYSIPGRWGAAEFKRLSTAIAKVMPASKQGHPAIRS
jgi:hypothetical protein